MILKNELTSINQSFLHSRMIKDWGFENLVKKVYDESISEMKHANYVIERVLTLDFLQNLQDLGKLKIGEDVAEIFHSDLKLEEDNQTCLKSAITVCEELKDFVSREILKNILVDTEEHIDWIEAQNNVIAQIGIGNYLQEQINTNSS
ncbi:bacterioferritin [Alphaproteobacteria bacterium]|nr:bacterioferritin [Alphaproteobacteria bacterium]